MDVTGPTKAGWGGAGPDAVGRVEAASRQDARQAGRQRWLEQVRDALDRAAPAVDKLAGRAIDPVALGEARAHIADLLAEVAQLQQTIAGSRAGLTLSVATPMPLTPGSSDAAVAAAQAVAEMIAANARPAIDAQAALPADAVRSMMR